MTTSWTDYPATNTTHIKAVHVTEVRTAVDNHRAGYNLAGYAWTDNPLTNTTHIKAQHFTELQAAIQDLWNRQGFGTLPNWSSGITPGGPSNGTAATHIYASDINDVRSWVNQYETKTMMNIWTGFHWCSPVNPTNSATAQSLLQSSGRWATVLIVGASPGGTDSNFTDACDKALAAIQANGGSDLGQCVARIYFGSTGHPNLADVPSVFSPSPGAPSADQWLSANGYYNSLNYFVGKGGRYAVLFNELDNSSEPQYQIDARVIGYLAYALQNAYYNGGNRQLYVLFPGPSGLETSGAFQSYWNTYDFQSSPGVAQTFLERYGQGNVDPLLNNRTMLYHGGSGVTDGVALHCYASDLDHFASADPTYNEALSYLAWMATADSTGKVFVTESGGYTCTDPTCTNCPPGQDCYGSCGDVFNAGAVLSTFVVAANNQFRNAGSGYLQAVHGYILMESNCGATAQGGRALATNAINGFNAAKIFP